MQPNLSKIEKIKMAASHLTPAKFISWLEDSHLEDRNKKMTIDILNRDDVLNVNRDFVQLRVDTHVFVFDHGVFQRVEEWTATPKG